jgi:transglutaminase/protease-like cytokinesis protein 3
VGLAYDAGNRVFAKHAWNEIAIDGRWMSVDPTWNQIRADATHLRLSDETMAALDQSSSLNFKTLETTYVDGGS